MNEITNANGDIIQRFEYSAFGKLNKVRDTGGAEVAFNVAPVRTSFTYTGREYEPELGMYYCRARYYDPTTGRFLQKDPDPGKLLNPSSFLSSYVYTFNNPVIGKDPSGRFGFLAIILIAGLIGGSFNAYNASKSGADGWQIAGSFLTGFVAGGAGAAIAVTVGGFFGAFLGGAAAGAINYTGNTSIFGTEFSEGDFIANVGIGAVAGTIGYGIGSAVGKFFSNDATTVIGNPAGYSNPNNTPAQLIEQIPSSFLPNVLPIDSGIPAGCTGNGCLIIKP